MIVHKNWLNVQKNRGICSEIREIDKILVCYSLIPRSSINSSARILLSSPLIV